jgi:ParB family chromosome partitioning protein
MVAYRLVDIMGRASAANILGISVRELDKLVEIFELSEKFTSLRDPSAAITWSRELMGVSKQVLTPTVIEAVVKKVNQKRITSSKDLRKLRVILRDPVASDHFLSDGGDLESAMLRVTTVEKPSKSGFSEELDLVAEKIRNMPWTELNELKRNAPLVGKIEETEKLLRSLRNALAHER